MDPTTNNSIGTSVLIKSLSKENKKKGVFSVLTKSSSNESNITFVKNPLHDVVEELKNNNSRSDSSSSGEGASTRTNLVSSLNTIPGTPVNSVPATPYLTIKGHKCIEIIGPSNSRSRSESGSGVEGVKQSGLMPNPSNTSDFFSHSQNFPKEIINSVRSDSSVSTSSGEEKIKKAQKDIKKSINENREENEVFYVSEFFNFDLKKTHRKKIMPIMLLPCNNRDRITRFTSRFQKPFLGEIKKNAERVLINSVLIPHPCVIQKEDGTYFFQGCNLQKIDSNGIHVIDYLSAKAAGVYPFHPYLMHRERYSDFEVYSIHPLSYQSPHNIYLNIKLKEINRSFTEECKAILYFSTKKTTKKYETNILIGEDLILIGESDKFIVFYEDLYLHFVSKGTNKVSYSIQLDVPPKDFKSYFNYGMLYLDLAGCLIKINVDEQKIDFITTFVYEVNEEKGELQLKAFNCPVINLKDLNKSELERVRKQTLKGKKYLPAIVNRIEILDKEIFIVQTYYKKKFKRVLINAKNQEIHPNQFFEVKNPKSTYKAIEIAGIKYRLDKNENNEECLFRIEDGVGSGKVSKVYKINEAEEDVCCVLSFLKNGNLFYCRKDFTFAEPFTTNGIHFLIESMRDGKRELVTLKKTEVNDEAEIRNMPFQGNSYVHRNFLLVLNSFSKESMDISEEIPFEIKKNRPNSQFVKLDIMNLKSSKHKRLFFEGKDISLYPSLNEHLICCYITSSEPDKMISKNKQEEMYSNRSYFIIDLETGSVGLVKKDHLKMDFNFLVSSEQAGNYSSARDADQVIFIDKNNFLTRIAYVKDLTNNFKNNDCLIIKEVFKVDKDKSFL